MAAKAEAEVALLAMGVVVKVVKWELAKLLAEFSVV